MPKQRTWSDNQLIEAVKTSSSIRSVITKLGLIPAGGNYAQVAKKINELGLQLNHFKGQAWNKGLKYHTHKRKFIEELLTENSSSQSYKLKRRLFEENIKQPKCELCGWSEKTKDGRIPVELDHINGEHSDNRLSNLRILCPNCHSLQPTHRGRNKKR